MAAKFNTVRLDTDYTSDK